MRRKRNISAMIFLGFFLACCVHIASYDQHAYEQATSLKVEAMALVGQATEPYGQHEQEIDAFKLRMLKAYEYAKGIPKNVDTADQWAILIDEKGKSMFGFLQFWKEKNTLSKAFTEEYQKEIEKHFNKIIELEASKLGSDKI